MFMGVHVRGPGPHCWRAHSQVNDAIEACARWNLRCNGLISQPNRETNMGRNGENPFPMPSEIGGFPGAEGWEEMYPYFTRFRPEDDKLFWFYNSMHFPEPLSAFDGIGPEVPYTALGAMTGRVFAFPTVLGIEYRILNGRVYITSHAVTDLQKIEERLAEFQKRAGHYYQNWTELFA